MDGQGQAPTVLVADIIGPTVLAQGAAAGRRCSLIRLGGCNLSCSWCDSAATWDAARYDLTNRLSHWPAAEVGAAARSCDPGLVVVTGGEPLLQQRSAGWLPLLDSLAGVEVGLETNGTIVPSDETIRRVSWITVSPKLPHSGDPSWDRIKGDALVRWGELSRTLQVEFLFVVRDVGDLETISALAAIHDLEAQRVWVCPEGTSAVGVSILLHEIAEATIRAGFNLAPRIVNPFGGTAAAQRVAAQFAALQPATGMLPVLGQPQTQSETVAPEREPMAPVGARFRGR